MVYVADWDEFTRKAEQLYQAQPGRTRYSIKYRHADAKVVLKVTDDVTCLKYRTDQAQDVKKIEKFSSTLMHMMVSAE